VQRSVTSPDLCWSTAKHPAQPTGSTSTRRAAECCSSHGSISWVREPGSITARTFEIAFLDAGVEAYVFTFG
jgi:hypothetical protein